MATVRSDRTRVVSMATEVVLRDGTAAMLWPMSPNDGRGLRERFRQLSSETRYNRFLTPTLELSDELLGILVDGVDCVDHLALVLVAFPEAGSERAVGVGRLVRYPDSDLADVAITVEDAWQGRGAGTTLLAELVARRPPEVTGLLTLVGVDNPASLAMLTRLGATRTTPAGSGAIEVRVQLS